MRANLSVDSNHVEPNVAQVLEGLLLKVPVGVDADPAVVHPVVDSVRVLWVGKVEQFSL